MDTVEQKKTPMSKEEDVKGAVQLEVREMIGISLQVHTLTVGAKMASHQDKCTEATDMQWETSGTPVIEEPWPGLLQEYVLDYTPLV
jgi:hypothetical protein